MKKVAIIGGGGIGSYLVDELYRLIMADQMDLEISVFDDDVVESKNIKYQNFNIKNL